MGILSGKDLYNGKYITAEIMDSSKQLHHVAIRRTIGDYFLVDINGQIYCFKLDASRIMTHRGQSTRSFGVIWYTTKNYNPISAGDNAVLEEVLRVNSLPHVNHKMLSTMKLLGNREKQMPTGQQFAGHQLQALIDEIGAHEDEYQEQVRNIKNYLQHLEVKQIVTPLREVSEFLQDELIVPDPKFLGDIVSTLQRVDQEHKKVANVPTTGKLPWLKILLIMTLVGVLCGVGWYLYSSGAFSNFSIGGFGFGGTGTSQDIMKAYPTPESLKVAIAQGKVKESDLPPDIKREVDAIKLPATPPQAK